MVGIFHILADNEIENEIFYELLCVFIVDTK